MTILYINCKKCNKVFNFDAGRIIIAPEQKIISHNKIKCIYCGESSNEFLGITKENTKTLCDVYDEQEKKRIIKNYRPGKLVDYSIIFGREKKFKILFELNEYYVLDSYCTVCNCNCRDVFFDFYFKDNEESPAKWCFSFSYNYFNGKVSENECINYEKSKKIIDLLIKELQISFKQRHDELKNFFRLNVSNKLIDKSSKNKKPSIKIGRNEPCPCGSGKKYKKCCIDKEQK